MTIKKLTTSINSEKKKLIEKAKKKGIYENFGQKEVSKLKDKFINISSYTDEMNKMRVLLSNFDDWCSSYNN